MKNNNYNLAGFLGTLLLIALLFMPAIASAQQHLSDQQVNAEIAWLSNTNQAISQPLADAYLSGGGITLYSNGSYQLDIGGGVVSNEWCVQEAYEAVFAATGDGVLAAENAAGLLTPQEEEEARHPEGGFSALLNHWTVVHGYYQNEGGGGGGLLN